MNAYFDAMRRYANFTGRSTRTQFWLFYLFLFIGAIIAALADAVIWPDLNDPNSGIMVGLLTLAHLLPSIAVTVRRIRDAGYSGWMVLIAFVPIVGLIAVLVFTLQPTKAPQGLEYGHAPAQPAAPAASPPVAAPQPRQSGLDASAFDRLERLGALKASGAITDDEFARMKAQIIDTGVAS